MPLSCDVAGEMRTTSIIERSYRPSTVAAIRSKPYFEIGDDVEGEGGNQAMAILDAGYRVLDRG
jgi:hypothetical protein